MSAATVPLDDEFDVAFADRIARLETYNKHHYRPNSYLHKWWARRCGSTFRLILKHLVTDEGQRDYYAPGGLAGKLILDPMMGGATTLHEAIRLGANVVGADLDPIPVLQARATLSALPLPELEQAFTGFYQALRRDLDEYWQTACPVCAVPALVRFVLYGLCRTCDCGPALFVDSTVLRQEPDGSLIRICPKCHAVVAGGEACHCPPEPGLPPLIEKGTARCGTCGAAYVDDLRTPYYARYRPLVIAGRCAQHRLFYKAPDTADRQLGQRADDARSRLRFDPTAFAVEPGPKSIQLIRRGISSYLDLFSSRQLLYLERAIALLPSFAPLVRLNLALLVSTSLEFNSLLCGYKGRHKRRAGAIRHTFSHHAYAFPYTALENNAIYQRKASGTLQKLFHARLHRGREWAQRPRERDVKRKRPIFIAIPGEVDAGVEVEQSADLQDGTHRFWLQQGSSTRLNVASGSIDYVVTDPPYFDSVQYSDLAAFFRVWLRQLLPDAADWSYDVSQSAVDPHDNGRESRYTEIISGIFQECHRVLRPESGRFIFTFHHWNPKSWAALTQALQQAGFVLLNRYVVHAENPMSVHIANMNALTHDAILVLAPLEAGQQRLWQRPAQINSKASYQFCLDCATMLGWMLNVRLDAAEIKAQWQQALRDGKSL